VAAILLVLAALGLDWNEIRGTYGSATLQLLRRGLGEVDERIEAVAASEEIPPAVRDELESLRTEVKALTPVGRSDARANSFPRRTGAGTSANS
jgi:hypothetical protein